MIFKRKKTREDSGFSFVEVLLTTALFLILASLGMGSYFKYYTFSLSNNDFNQISKTLRETRFRAMKNPYDSAYGVYLNVGSKEVISFRDTYTPGNPENNVVPLHNLEIDSLNLQPSPGVTDTILFEKLTGKTQNTGSFTVTSDEFEYTFNINLQGAFE